MIALFRRKRIVVIVNKKDLVYIIVLLYNIYYFAIYVYTTRNTICAQEVITVHDIHGKETAAKRK